MLNTGDIHLVYLAFENDLEEQLSKLLLEAYRILLWLQSHRNGWTEMCLHLK